MSPGPTISASKSGAKSSPVWRSSDGRFPRLTLKAAPEAFHELLEIEGISPAPYVGRYKWVTLANSNVLPAGDLEALIRQSYDLVEANAPRKKPKRKIAAGRRKTK